MLLAYQKKDVMNLTYQYINDVVGLFFYFVCFESAAISIISLQTKSAFT